MPEILVFPPHLNHAKAALVAAGISVTQDSAAYAALMFAAIAWERTPQANRAEELRQLNVQTQDELERVSSALLEERKKSERLQADLLEARQAVGALKDLKGAREQLSTVMKENHRLRLQLEGLLPEGTPLAERVAAGSPMMKRQKTEVSSLKNMLQQAQDNLAIAKQAAGHTKGLRTHLKKIQAALNNPDFTPDQKLADIATQATWGLEVGTEADIARHKTTEI